MVFAQLTWREELRDIETCFNARPECLNYLEFEKPIARSTLAEANEQRDWRIWQDSRLWLISKARKLYKMCWCVELFFKWIKQNLLIKHFYVNSLNAVKTQIWIVIAVYLIIAILHKDLKLSGSLQLLSVHRFEKIPM